MNTRSRGSKEYAQVAKKKAGGPELIFAMRNKKAQKEKV
jgi:hypothetical protein